MTNKIRITYQILIIACMTLMVRAEEQKQKTTSVSAADLTIKLSKVYGEKSLKKKGKNEKVYTYPTGYEISIRNNRKEPIGNMIANYTIYYSTQALKGEERMNWKRKGNVKCPDLGKWSEGTVRTKMIELRKGWGSKGSSSKKGKKSAKNTIYGKDIMIGCTVDIYVDGKHITTQDSGMLKIPEGAQSDGSGEAKKQKKNQKKK